MINYRQELEQIIVTAEQMRQIEEGIFAAGMPVAALMERAAFLTASRIQQLYPFPKISRVGILVGPGHNGGDALVIAREMHLNGYEVSLYQPFTKLKELTAQHTKYAVHLGIPFAETMESLSNCALIIDGLFGFGLERSISGNIATAISQINQWSNPVVSIDIPSGLHTDTGEVLGTAIRATQTLCLGLWKLAFFQDQALEYLGRVERIDFGILPQDVWAVISQPAPIQQINLSVVKKNLPLPRPVVTHKYQQGHLLVICGSERYAGGAVLTGLGARGSGVGMLSMAVPQELKPILVNNLPEALIIGCPTTATGAISRLPEDVDYSKYTALACGPGLTTEAELVVATALTAECPLILDADALNIIAMNKGRLGGVRKYPTILTPHLGEFKRLFPEIESQDRIKAVQMAAAQSGAIVLLKGARTAIAHPGGSVWVIGESTPALARGGSGDVLTGLIGGLVAANSKEQTLSTIVATAAWWHAQAGILAAAARTELGVDAFTVSQYVGKSLQRLLRN